MSNIQKKNHLKELVSRDSLKDPGSNPSVLPKQRNRLFFYILKSTTWWGNLKGFVTVQMRRLLHHHLLPLNTLYLTCNPNYTQPSFHTDWLTDSSLHFPLASLSLQEKRKWQRNKEKLRKTRWFKIDNTKWK